MAAQDEHKHTDVVGGVRAAGRRRRARRLLASIICCAGWAPLAPANSEVNTNGPQALPAGESAAPAPAAELLQAGDDVEIASPEPAGAMVAVDSSGLPIVSTNGVIGTNGLVPLDTNGIGTNGVMVGTGGVQFAGTNGAPPPPQTDEEAVVGPPTVVEMREEALELDDRTDLVEEDGGEALPASEVDEFAVVHSAALGALREPDPPRYVRTVKEHAEYFGLKNYEDWGWLDFGVEVRTRYEHRGNYYRADQDTGELTVMRNRMYLGVREILDPVRFGFEFQDSRRFGDPIDDRSNVNETEILQAYVELFGKDAAGLDHPVRFRFGRMSFDSIDRRLVARNRFRNTTNAFAGFRLTLGDRATDWEIDLFAVNPIERRKDGADRTNDDEWLYGVTGYWRAWSPTIILEPYYYFLDSSDNSPRDVFRDVDARDYLNDLGDAFHEGDLLDSLDNLFGLRDALLVESARGKRQLHTLGLHGYGVVGQTGIDYDFNFAFQFGNSAGNSHRAFAMHTEVGYMPDLPRKPRVAFWVNYATGDRDPYDGVNERFDRLFGASHSLYGYSDLFTWQNMINPTLYFSFRPVALSNVRMEAFYRAYWLASKTDSWVVPGLRDPNGNSGRFVGQALETRLRYQWNRHAGLAAGYSYFMPGSFVDHTAGSADDSHFVYVQMMLRL